MKIALLEPLRVPESRIHELAQPLIDDGHQFTYYPEKTTHPNELYERSKDADIVMIANNPFPAKVIEKLEKTKFINVAFTGFDHVDSKACKDKGIAIANASGYATTAVAELALGLTLDLFRAISTGNNDIRKVDFQGPFQGREINGKTVGIVGTGHIGLETAKLFKAFGAKIIGYNRSEKQEAKDLGIELVDLDELLSQSDIVSVHLPLNGETKHLLNKEKLSLMKESAVIINVARGPIIDNAALTDLLNKGKIAGAGIDVFDGEPPLPADYRLLTAKNAILTPHVGFLSDEAMALRAEIAFENTRAFIEGHPKNIVQEA